MQLLNHRRRLALWLAALAMLVGSLAPTLSHAMRAMSGSAEGWVEVCTLAGSKWVRLDARDASEKTPAPGKSVEHCPYCTLQLPALGLPPAPLALVPPEPNKLRELAPHGLAAPPGSHAWLAAQPRAPPPIG